VIDKECLLSSRDHLKQLISAEKVRFLNSKIADCQGKKSLFKIVGTFLLKKPGHKLPHHVTLDELVERFSEFFVQKIENIRAGLEAAGPPCQPDQHTQAGALTSFANVSVADVASLLKSCPVKSSLRDPIPTFFLLQFADLLLHPITKIINLSLSSGVFPDEMKLALVTPVLKKSDLDSNVLSNYRPVSNLSFLSKLVERVVVKQLTFHLESENLMVPVQSAYRKNHSTETALLKIVNDLLLSVDGKNAAILALLDQRAAFDAVDHSILIDRLTARFCVWLSPKLGSVLPGESITVCLRIWCLFSPNFISLWCPSRLGFGSDHVPPLQKPTA
jgi:hypothetical protein